jgi:hypothetical protein
VGNNSSTINELPFISSNDDRIFIAEYGTTTFSDIINAANTDNKSVFCRSADGGIINLAYCHADGARFVGYTLYGEQELYCGPNDEWTVNNINILSTNVTHGEVSLSDILETYILNIDYNTLLAFDTSEIVTGATSTTSVLGQAILGQMVLA